MHEHERTKSFKNELAIHAPGLTKSYSKIHALRGINLSVQRGGIFGFLGPNRAGKTTSIRCMLDMIRPDAGNILILGLDPQKEPVAFSVRWIKMQENSSEKILVKNP